MTASLTAAIATAGLLGVTHAIEPDHVAGISALTSEYADSRRSLIAGASFALGHVCLVVVWVLVGYFLLGRTNYPPLLEAIGTAGVGVLLGLLGAAMAIVGLRRLVHVHTHEHGETVHRHPHLHLFPFGSSDHGHDHDAASYLKTGIVGALFTLSPPLTMIAFSSSLFPLYGPGVIALAVTVYAVAIVVTMGLLGAGVGRLFSIADGAGDRAHAALQFVTGLVLGIVAISVLRGDLFGFF